MLTTANKEPKPYHFTFSGDPLHISHQSDATGEGVFLDLASIFDTPDFYSRNDLRKGFISTVTGLPTSDPMDTIGNQSKAKQALEINFNGAIKSYTQITGDNGNFRVVMIGLENRTHYIMVKGNVNFTFYVDASSSNAKEGLHALINSNLNKCPRVYRKTAMTVPNFYELIFTAVYKEKVILPISVTSKCGQKLRSKLYFDPANPKSNMISILGYVFPFNLHMFPKWQILKALERTTA